MRIHLLAALSLTLALPLASPCAADWKAHVVQQTNGSAARIMLPAQLQIVTEPLNEITGVPYLVYIPDQDQVLMTLAYYLPHQAALLGSADHGATWSKIRFMRQDEKGNSTLGFQTGLSYLGGGKIITGTGYLSEDYGVTWPTYRPVPSCWAGKGFYGWDPMLVDRDPKTGAVTRLTVSDYRQVDPAQLYSSQASVFFSTDEGKTWSAPVTPSEWKGVNEVAFVRAKNGDLVAACRTDNSERFVKKGIELDHYCGLAVSISRDDGQSWSTLNRLYDWGRHHPCMVVMPNGDIVMTYVVRLGYVRAADGYPQFGVEAVVSRDNGQTWDLDHKYILSSWKGNRKGGPNEWWPSSQATSTVLLPDGWLLTAFGTGYRSEPRAADGSPSPRDVGVVRWQVNDKGLNDDKTLANTPWDSDLRNQFELTPAAAAPGAQGQDRLNLVTQAAGATLTASTTGIDPNVLLRSSYFPSAAFMLDTIPGWLEIRWASPQLITEVVIHGGEPAQKNLPSGECAPVEYTLQYDALGVWTAAVPPVRQTLDAQSPRGADGGLLFRHTFPGVTTSALRLCVTRTNDTGKRVSSPDKVIVEPGKLATTLRGIEVYGK
jgi:hypothetical protein